MIRRPAKILSTWVVLLGTALPLVGAPLAAAADISVSSGGGLRSDDLPARTIANEEDGAVAPRRTPNPFRTSRGNALNPFKTSRTSPAAPKAAPRPAPRREQKLPPGVITPEQLQTLFRQMAAQRDIAFRFPADGCYARAHLMIRRMQQLGYRPYKVWTFANGLNLHVKTRNHPRGYVEWAYHVAPYLRVRYPDGKIYAMVIDPSLFPGPVGIATWVKAQKKGWYVRNPIVRQTLVNEAPVLPGGVYVGGTGYWKGADPGEGKDRHAWRTMMRYKPYEGQVPPPGLIKTNS